MGEYQLSTTGNAYKLSNLKPLPAGCDATDAFYSLHRHEVFEKPQFQRLQIGTLVGEQSKCYGRVPGSVSSVPYAEPNWLSPAYHSAYYNEVRESVNLVARTCCNEEDFAESQTISKGHEAILR